MLCNVKILIIGQNKCRPEKPPNMGKMLQYSYLTKQWKSKNLIIRKRNVDQAKTQYGGDVVMFLPIKIIKNKKLNYPQKNVGLAHGFKTICKAF